MNNEGSMRLLHGMYVLNTWGLSTFPQVLSKIEAYIAFPGNLYAGYIPNLVPELGTHSTYCYYYAYFERRIIDGSCYMVLGLNRPASWEFANIFMELNLLIPVGNGTYYRETVWPMGWQQFDRKAIGSAAGILTKAVAPPPAGSFYEYIIPPVGGNGGKQNTVGIWGNGIDYNTTDRKPCYCIGQSAINFEINPEYASVRNFNVVHYKKIRTYNFDRDYYVYDRFTSNPIWEYVLPGQIVPKP